MKQQPASGDPYPPDSSCFPGEFQDSNEGAREIFLVPRESPLSDGTLTHAEERPIQSLNVPERDERGKREKPQSIDESNSSSIGIENDLLPILNTASYALEHDPVDVEDVSQPPIDSLLSKNSLVSAEGASIIPVQPLNTSTVDSSDNRSTDLGLLEKRLEAIYVQESRLNEQIVKAKRKNAVGTIVADAKKPLQLLKFTDAVGRKYSFPWHLCNTWEVCILKEPL